MTKVFDFIIIGSGMGGLASAIILAKEGYSVCVLEKNNQYGGNLQTFVRNKTILDTGVHYLGSLGKGENLYQFFKYLEIIDKIDLEKMNSAFDFISFGDQTEKFPYAQGYKNFKHHLIQAFPDEKYAIEKYCDDIRTVCKNFPLYNLENGTLYNPKILTINLKDYLEKLTKDKTLRGVLVGSNLLYAGNQDTPFYIHALTVNSYITSAWRCIKGGSQITKALVKVLRENGGAIFKRQEITEFVFDNKKITSVKTKSNDTFKAKRFISNIDLNTTIQLAQEDSFRKSFVNRVKSLAVTPSSFSLHLLLKPNSIPYLNYNIYHFDKVTDVWDASVNISENWPRNYMLSMGTTKPNAKYAESLSVLCYMDYKEVKRWENSVNNFVHPCTRPEKYEQFKKEKTEIIVQKITNHFPNIREAIVATYASTPLTYRDYIGGKNGNMYGFAKYSKTPLHTQFSPKTKIENLYLTGQYVNLHGILGVTIGAFNTCAEIIGRTKLINKIEKC